MNDDLPGDYGLFEELQDLVAGSLRDDLSSEQQARLAGLIGQDVRTLDLYLNVVFETSILLTWARHDGSEGDQIPKQTGDLLEGAPQSATSGPTPVAASVPPYPLVVGASSAGVGVPGSVCPGTTGYLMSHELFLGYIVATVLFGVAALIGANVSMSSRPRQEITARAPSQAAPSVAGAPTVVSVARITGMVGCAWTDQSRAPSTGRVLLGDEFALDSGLMEITYDSGAKVILQGPCTYKVDSKTGGFLELGRLTARVETKRGRGGEGETRRLAAQPVAANRLPRTSDSRSPIDKSPPVPLSPSPPLFSVHTPTAVVNDLGTEFGVEVDENKGSGVHVFVGTVDFVPVDEPTHGVQIGAGEARRISAAGGEVEKIALDPEEFARPRAMLAGRFKQDEILFRDSFETFALGTRWRATATDISPRSPDVLQATLDKGRTALWMKADPISRKSLPAWAIETVEQFPLQNLASIQVDVVFRSGNEVLPTSFETWLFGSTGKMVRIYTHHYAGRGVTADAVRFAATAPRWNFLARESVRTKDTYQAGDAYRYRFIISVNRRDCQFVMQDDVNQAVIYRTKLDIVTLADLGDKAKVILRMVTRSGEAAEQWIYGVTVRGRPSATRYPPSKSKDIPKHTSGYPAAKPHNASRVG
jgi:hypothetical protein